MHVVDPRRVSIDTDGGNVTDAQIRSAIQRNQLFIALDARKLTEDSAVLLSSALQAFPSDYLFYTYIPEKKYQESILQCFQPDDQIGYHSGISIYNGDSAGRFARCFGDHSRWFEWLFGAFRSEQKNEIADILKHGALAADDFDPTWRFADYSIYLNEEYGHITLSCNREEFFDAFIEFASALEVR